MKRLGNKGFTFIELVIVAAIMGIVAMAGISSILFSQGNVFTAQTAEMFSALTQARNTASRRLECVRLRVVSNSQVNIEAFAPTSARSCVGPFTAPLRPAIVIDFESVVISGFTAGNRGLGREIFYNPFGGLVADQLVTFNMVNPEGRRANFRIYPVLGHARMN